MYPFPYPVCDPATADESPMPLLFLSAICFIGAVIIAFFFHDEERPVWAPLEEDDVPHLYAIKDSITGKILVGTTMIPDYPEYWKPTHYDIITLVERKDNAHEVFFTQNLMCEHGFDMVRGGPWTMEGCMPDGMINDKAVIDRYNRGVCLRCGSNLHVAEKCRDNHPKDSFAISPYFPKAKLFFV